MWEIGVVLRKEPLIVGVLLVVSVFTHIFNGIFGIKSICTTYGYPFSFSPSSSSSPVCTISPPTPSTFISTIQFSTRPCSFCAGASLVPSSQHPPSLQLSHETVKRLSISTMIPTLPSYEQASKKAVPSFHFHLYLSLLRKLLLNELKNCSVSVITKLNHFFLGGLVDEIISLAIELGVTYQVNKIDAGAEYGLYWRTTSCDVYVFVFDDIMSIYDAIDKDDKKWDFFGTYIFITNSELQDLRRFSTAYKLAKTHKSIFIIPGKTNDELELWTHWMYTNRTFRFVNKWRNGSLLQPKTNFFPDKVRRLEGYPMRILAHQHAPSLFCEVDDDGFLYNIGGIDYKFTLILAKYLDFTPIWEHPGPELWGQILPNGTFTGHVGQIGTHDLAEIGLSNTFIVWDRAQFCSFSIPYDYETACFVTPSPKPLPRWMGLGFPFSLDVWLLFLVTIIGIGLVIPCIANWLPERDFKIFHTPQTSMLYSLCSFTNQSQSLPKTTPMQILVAIVLLMGFTTAVSYSGNLTAFLTIETLDTPLKTVSQLDRTGLPIFGFSNFWGLLFAESSNRHLQNLAPRYQDFLHTFPKFSDVAQGRATLIENRQHLLYVKRQYYTNQRDESPLRIMEECIAPYGIGAVLRRNSPLKANMDKVILWLQEAGLMWRFFEETLAEDHWEEGEGSEWIQEQRTLPPPPQGPQPLTMEHMQGAFALILAGNLVASVVFAVEMAANACYKAPTDNPAKQMHK